MQHTDEEENGRRSGARLFSLPDSLAARRPTTLVSDLGAASLSLSRFVQFSLSNSLLFLIASNCNVRDAASCFDSLFVLRSPSFPTHARDASRWLAMTIDEERRRSFSTNSERERERERERKSFGARSILAIICHRPKRRREDSIDPSFAGVPLAFARAKGKV